MGLHDKITKAVQKAFDTSLADAVGVVSLTYTSAAGYNTTTGLVTNTPITVVSRGVAANVSNEMVDGESILVSDTKFLILKDELSVTPKVSDKITVDGIDYSVNIVLIDPAKVAWSLVGRAV